MAGGRASEPVVDKAIDLVQRTGDQT